MEPRAIGSRRRNMPPPLTGLVRLIPAGVPRAGGAQYLCRHSPPQGGEPAPRVCRHGHIPPVRSHNTLT
eukprot:4960959-Pyramimonas_sp.AAC.1